MADTPHLRSSIRLKLTLCFALTMTILMVAGGILGARQLAHLLEENTDSRLSRSGDLLEHLIHNEEGDGTVGDEQQCREIRKSGMGHYEGISIQKRTPEGDVICATENFGGLHFPLDHQSLLQRKKGESSFVTWESEKGERFRVMTRPFFDDKQALVGILQIGEKTEANEIILERLLWAHALLSPLLILAVSGCGWFLAGRTLAPLRQITDDIRKINADNLSLRLPIAPKRNELTDLSISINETLERLANSFSRIKQFTGDASHELRTPLAILKGETEVSLRWAKGEEELRQTLASNLEEIERMERIAEGLLHLAKSESGEFRLNLSSFSLNDLLQELYLHSQNLGEAKKIETILQLQVDHEVYILADQMHLHRALLNFVTNAIKYTPEGGVVTLILALSDENEARIHVRDNGMGIPAEHLPHIFERFYRVDEARNRNIGGTGLGLSIVKAIITAHHGRIDVTSTPGQGSEFIVSLPLTPPSLLGSPS